MSKLTALFSSGF